MKKYHSMIILLELIEHKAQEVFLVSAKFKIICKYLFENKEKFNLKGIKQVTNTARLGKWN